jgi:chromosome segregation ATPase
MPSSPPESAEAAERNGERKASTTEEGVEEEDAEAEESGDTSTLPAGTDERLQAMQDERDSLRAEVSELRRNLESLQEKHNDELTGVKEDLAQSEQGKEHAETQYRNLLGKVNTIRSQLGERLKEDQGKIEELEGTNNQQREENERLQESISELNGKLEEQNSEIAELRSRTSLSTNNWAKERDDLVSREAYIREEYEVAKQAMQDWEILATEERSRREALEERSQELEDQLNTQREAYERVQNEAETQSGTVDGLQRALRDLQEERKRELREMVEQSQAQLEELRTQSKAADDSAAQLKSQLEETQKELERALPFEKEVKEKNLLLGKARHEAVILNEHLVKALRFLKRGKPEDNVDRHLVTNYLLQFLALDRSDAKKFQILQLIAALLGWSEEQKEQAGLLRQGALAGGSLRVPVSPFRRTPSTPSLSTDFVPESPAGATRESLAELWSEFLEREAEAGSTTGSSRRGSASRSLRSPSLASVTSPIGGTGGRQSPEIKRKESSSAGPASSTQTG